MEHITCQFCNEIINTYEIKKDIRCENKTIIQEEYGKVCSKCGSMNECNIVNGYMNFHENKHKIKKSIYFRKVI